MNDLDRFTYAEITDQYRAAARNETDRYVALAQWRDRWPVGTRSVSTDPEYRVMLAAAEEACELRRVLSLELDRRDA